VIAQLVEDLLHLEGSRDGLYENGCPEGSSVDAQGILRVAEDVVPQARLEMALDLGKVEVRAAPPLQEAVRVVPDVEAEIHERPGHRFPVNIDVLVPQVPSPRTHQQGGEVVSQLVLPAVRARELDRLIDGIDEIHVALGHVGPCRGVRVLEVRHEAVGSGVERVDDHLAIGRARYLDPAVLHVARRRGDLPVPRTHALGARQEVQPLARIEARLALPAPVEQGPALAPELPLQPGNEAESSLGEDLRDPPTHGGVNLDSVGASHQWPPIDRSTSSTG
jgi:hypothetical protein